MNVFLWRWTILSLEDAFRTSLITARERFVLTAAKGNYGVGSFAVSENSLKYTQREHIVLLREKAKGESDKDNLAWTQAFQFCNALLLFL